MDSNKGKLYICPTPIGNLSDVSKRLEDVLSSVDLVCCEDTRVTQKLLNALSINVKLKRLDENLMDKKALEIVDIVKNDHNVAYCSDAGVPGVSDPGLKLVNLARQSNVEVIVLPGPCAAINAYVASGFCAGKFYFGGFLPRKINDIKQELRQTSSINAVLIYYESPVRLLKSLKVIADVLPTRQIAVCRELTKVHEEVLLDTAQNLYDILNKREKIKGEIALVIDAARDVELDSKKSKNIDFAIKMYQNLKNLDISKKDICKVLCEVCEISKNDAYKISLGDF